MTTERPWQSRTMWVNFVSGAAALSVVFGFDLGLDAETQARAVAAIMFFVNFINMILRKISTKQITMKPVDHVETDPPTGV